MTKYGLRTRVYLLTIFPTLVIGVLLASYFTFNRSQQLDNFIIEQGVNVVEPLAIASEMAMDEQSREKIKHLVSLSHQKNSIFIKSIAIFNEQNQLFVTSNYHKNFEQLKLKTELQKLQATEVEVFEQFLILRSPIFSDQFYHNPESDSDEHVMGYVALQYDRDRSFLLFFKDTAIAVLIVVLGLLIAAGLSLRLMKSVTKPISDMVVVVDNIARGRLNARVEGKYTGELEQLGSGINSMAMSLTTYQEEMQQSIDQATSDLRETLEQIEIQNVELDIAKKSAQEAAKIKSEFLANMSHELRTPLNGVIGFARQLQKTSLSPTQIDHIQTIEKSANNLLTIISDVLDFSKLEAGKLILEKITFSIRQTTEETMYLLAHSANDKNLELSLLIDNDVPDDVIGDPLRFQQVLTNLTSNAIKFTEHGDIHIHIWLEVQEGTDLLIKVAVQDTGVGISEEHQLRLFQSFNQADTSITRRYGGTGLGLVITQKLVQQMGGEILLSSEVGQGSTFLFSVRLEISHTPVSSTPNIKRLQGQRILMLEQNEKSRKSIKQAVAPWPITLTACREPELWERELQQDHDWVLLGHDPSEPLSTLCSRVEIAAQSGQALIVMLASNDPIVADQLLAKGATFCLNKPVSLNKLALAIAGDEPEEAELNQLLLTASDAKSDFTVMAVDDNAANLKLISAILGEMVGNVHSFKNGKEAVEAAQKKRYDLIFMDIQMPILDGISACQQIRTLALNKNTPIIAVTAHAMAGEKERLLQVGMDDYLAKPLDETSLKQALKTWAVEAHHNQSNEHAQATVNISTVSKQISKPVKQQKEVTPKKRLRSETRKPLNEQEKAAFNNKSKAPEATTVKARRLSAESRAPLSQTANNTKDEVKETQQTASKTKIAPKVIDWPLALKRAHNKEDLAREMLQMLVTSTDDLLKAQQAALDGLLSSEDLTKAVHKFHGGCSYCGCPNLKSLAATLEQQLKQGASIADIEPELFELEDEIDKMKLAATEYI